MPDLEFKPVAHDREAFLAKARMREGFAEAYAGLAPEYELVAQLLAARARAGLTQEAVAARMQTTKSAVSRLESGSRHAPSLGTLRRYARAVGCELEVRLVPAK
jgi:DNA-binding XRE family transcriptional regulator